MAKSPLYTDIGPFAAIAPDSVVVISSVPSALVPDLPIVKLDISVVLRLVIAIALSKSSPNG